MTNMMGIARTTRRWNRLQNCCVQGAARSARKRNAAAWNSERLVGSKTDAAPRRMRLNAAPAVDHPGFRTGCAEPAMNLSRIT